MKLNTCCWNSPFYVYLSSFSSGAAATYGECRWIRPNNFSFSLALKRIRATRLFAIQTNPIFLSSVPVLRQLCHSSVECVSLTCCSSSCELVLEQNVTKLIISWITLWFDEYYLRLFSHFSLHKSSRSVTSRGHLFPLHIFYRIGVRALAGPF